MTAQRADRAMGRRALLLGGIAAGATAVAACASTLAGTPDNPVAPKPAAPVRPTVRFGLNYTPSKYWWYAWTNWEPTRISDDLGQIASLGMDHIRAQLMWDIFQPQANQVNGQLMDRLAQLLDLAGEHKLDVDISVLTGYLSGHQYIPQWARAGNWVNRPDLVQGELFFFSKLGELVGKHPRLMGFDTGNELIGRAPSQDDLELSLWTAQLIGVARQYAPNGVHTCSPTGLFVPSHPKVLSTMGDVTVVHPWYFLTAGVVDGKIREEPLHHGEYNIEYLKSFHTFAPQSPRRQVWVQEIGAPPTNFKGTVSIPDSLAPDFATSCYENMLSCEDVFGITWWDSHDINTATTPATFGQPEPVLGVFDVNGKEKPIGTAIADVIKRWKAGSIPIPEKRTVAIVGENSNLFNEQWDTRKVRAAVVQPGLASDSTYLARRGITSVISA